MNHRIQDLLDRILSAAPMPREAYPGGVVGHSPAVRSLVELAWQEMAIVMYSIGLVSGLMIALMFILAVVFKTSIPAIMKAVANAPAPH